MAMIAFDKHLRKNSSPGRDILFKRSPVLKQRFDAVSNGSCSSVLGLVQELSESRGRQFDEVARMYILARQTEHENEDTILSKKEQSHLEQSDFVKFGDGTTEAKSKSHQEMERKERLRETTFQQPFNVSFSFHYFLLYFFNNFLFTQEISASFDKIQ